MNVSRQAGIIHAANYITLRSDLPHMGKKSRIAYGTSWKGKRMSRIRNGEDVAL